MLHAVSRSMVTQSSHASSIHFLRFTVSQCDLDVSMRYASMNVFK